MMSYGRFGRTAGLMTKLAAFTRRVWPSAGDFATASVPTTVPAPGRLATSSGLPQRSAKGSASTRARKSALPPGGKGTTTVTGLAGKPCAMPNDAMHVRTSASTKRDGVRFFNLNPRVKGMEEITIVAK